ncbi:MAG: 50S ribosomal protein L29 [Candidatus Marinimicrobia bacterium]|nr:50S ribosomal protein L29 [Candidatus Neomarinimicrobiota bacterium]MBL7046360.1 50S ribosomal protein L29 [Candidatus Neomarinimicrobiota bacterium]
MKKEELKEITVAELQTRLEDDLEELENLRFQKALQQLENPLRIRFLRREIAQVKTLLKEYELGIRKKRFKE